MSLREHKGRQIFTLPEAWNERFNVTLIGCGGSGSEMVDALMRLHHVLLHFGHPRGVSLELYDADTVSPANVGRQRFLSADVGKNKAKVLARRYGLLYDTHITAHAEHCRPNLPRQQDLVITCVDKATFRVDLARWANKKAGSPDWDRPDPKTLWLDLGNGSHTGQAVLGHLCDQAPGTLPNVASLFVELAKVRDDEEPSCSLEAALAAQRLGINRLLVDAAVFSVLAPLFTQGWIDVHGAFVDLEKASMRPLRIGAESWGFLGHTRPNAYWADSATQLKSAPNPGTKAATGVASAPHCKTGHDIDG